jgi:hypothetical protein
MTLAGLRPIAPLMLPLMFEPAILRRIPGLIIRDVIERMPAIGHL